MADTSENVYPGLDFSDTGKNGVVLPYHDAGVVTAVPNHLGWKSATLRYSLFLDGVCTAFDCKFCYP